MKKTCNNVNTINGWSRSRRVRAKSHSLTLNLRGAKMIRRYNNLVSLDNTGTIYWCCTHGCGDVS